MSGTVDCDGAVYSAGELQEALCGCGAGQGLDDRTGRAASSRVQKTSSRLLARLEEWHAASAEAAPTATARLAVPMRMKVLKLCTTGKDRPLSPLGFQDCSKSTPWGLVNP